MRLGRTAWLVLGIGIFAIALIALLVVYLGKSSEEKQKMADLATAETQLTQLISGREALETQLPDQQSKLAEAQSLLFKTQAIFPELTENIEYDEVLAELAHDYDLELMSMAAEGPQEEELEGVICMVISFEVQVRGEVSNMLDMVNAIAMDERLATASVELANITTRIEEGREPLGTIQFTGFSYPRE
jgi:uncharacterized protein YggL (DUF469 family)